MTTFIIADIIISIKNETSSKLIIPSAYVNFKDFENINTDFEIRLTNIKLDKFDSKNKVYEAIDKQLDRKQVLWNIYKSDKGIFIKTFNISEYNSEESITFLTNNSNYCDIYQNKNPQEPFNPFMYPLGSILLFYILNKHNGILMHASAVFTNNKGYIFTGKSGVGKTTISHIFTKKYAKLIHDDRIAIRKIDTKYYMYNTPIYNNDTSKRSVITEIFLLKQDNENSLTKIDGAKAISMLLANCIHQNYNDSLLSYLLNFLSDLSETTPIYILNFKKDDSIVNFLTENIK